MRNPLNYRVVYLMEVAGLTEDAALERVYGRGWRRHRGEVHNYLVLTGRKEADTLREVAGTIVHPSEG